MGKGEGAFWPAGTDIGKDGLRFGLQQCFNWRRGDMRFFVLRPPVVLSRRHGEVLLT